MCEADQNISIKYSGLNINIQNRLTNHTLLALNPKIQFGLPDPNDNVLEERIEWNSISNRERKRLAT